MKDATVELSTGGDWEHDCSLFESLDEGFCILEQVAGSPGEPLDFRVLQANSAFAAQTGLAGAVGMTIRQVVSAVDETALLTYDTVLRTGLPIRFEQGSVSQGRFLELFAFRINDRPRRQVGVMVRDITERKAREEVRDESEVRYRRLFESAKDGILILDYESGKIVDANPFMGQLLAYPTKSFLGKELWEIGLFKDKAASEAAVTEMQASGYVRFEHLPLEAADGRHVEVEIVGNAYQEGPHSVMQCNIRDISERSRLEQTTHEQAVALAELHDRKDEFLAMLSHELRTPLAPIASAAQILRLQPHESGVQKQAREIIERQVGQLKHLIDDLLEVSRFTTGKVHLRRGPVVIGEVVERAVEATRPLMEWRRHELRVELPPEPIWLDGDAARLEQVVVNLLTNAAKYSDDGGRIALTLRPEGDQAVLRIRDTGLGIEPELLPRIFDLFTQATRSLDRAQGGLGIGLSLVKRLVELHGGTVEASSVLEQGSEFVVRLPVIPGPPVAVAALPVETVAPPKAGCRILIVDDSVDTAQSLAMLLSAVGHDVRVAYEGQTALGEIGSRRPDVVLMDIGLPGLDGFEVAKQIRGQRGMQDVVLVAMTGYGQAADRKKSQEAGFNHHLVKPADFDALEILLGTVCAARPGVGSEERPDVEPRASAIQ
jgi:PAS domain S-box-containing protein